MIRWIWRASFARRFSSGVLRNLKDDIAQVRSLKEGRANTLGDFTVLITADFFIQNAFRVNTVNTKTFVLMLAQRRPLNFISGQPVLLTDVLRDYNRSEFHHLFPKAFLTARGIPANRQGVLANFAFLSKVDNIALGGAAPSVYCARMPQNADQILASAVVPNSLSNDDYEIFLRDRSQMLERLANELIQ